MNSNDLNLASTSLRKGEALHLQHALGQRIEALGGRVWITMDGDLRDVVLDAGEGFTVDRSTDGLTTWTATLMQGLANEAVTAESRPGGGDWTVETVNPDGSKNLVTYTDGLWDKTEFKNSSNTVISSNSARKANNARGYDSINRLTHTKDSRTGAAGASETQYVSTISDAVAATIPPAGSSQTTSYTYDHRGRRTRRLDPGHSGAPLAHQSGAILENIKHYAATPSFL